MSAFPINPANIVTIDGVVTGAAFSAGDLANIDPADGVAKTIGAANTGRIVVAAADIASGAEGAFYIPPTIIRFENGNGTGSAVFRGEALAAESAVLLDDGSTNDSYAGVVVGPEASNADGADIDVQLSWGLGLVS